MREWARTYVGDIVRAAHPYTPLNSENILDTFERMHPEYNLDGAISTVDDDTLNTIGQMLHVITVGALHLSHYEKTGEMHPGLATVRV